MKYYLIKMKVGDKITMFFDCAGFTSEETERIIELTESTVTTDCEFYGINTQYNRKTGKLILRGDQENFGGAKRRIKPF